MKGREIEEESFNIIEKKLEGYPYPEREIIKRIVHATADFSFTNRVVFQGDPIPKGVNAIRAGRTIFTDVNMVKAGITGYNGKVKCFIDGEEVKSYAESSGKTRAASAFRLFKEEFLGAIVAVGNAPTALFEVCSLIEEGVTPALVVAAPVGFVGAKESKEKILELNVPAIVVRGRRGGSGIAAAIVNALIGLSRSGLSVEDPGRFP
jgi:precorrin-8X/cobalt-precorrin-8 methylmutase